MLRRTFLSMAPAAAVVPQAAGVPAQAGRAKVIDAHCHLEHRGNPAWTELDRALINTADKLGIDQMCCSIVPKTRPTTLEGARQNNEWVLDSMHRYPGRILGYCFVNPGYYRESLEDVKRCVEEHGFVGIKVYNDYRATEPVFYPLVELTIKLRVPILFHAGHTNWLPEPGQPRISDGGHIAELARRYPESMLICGHIAGGGDWEWTAKSLRGVPNAYLDTSGSTIAQGTVELATRIMGADRLLFGCDMLISASVGRLRSAEISDEDRRKILGGNMQRILSRRNG